MLGNFKKSCNVPGFIPLNVKSTVKCGNVMILRCKLYLLKLKKVWDIFQPYSIPFQNINLDSSKFDDDTISAGYKRMSNKARVYILQINKFKKVSPCGIETSQNI